VSRTLWNLFWRSHPPLHRHNHDIGEAGRGSHYRFLRFAPGSRVQTVDIARRTGVDFVLDITKERVPLPDESCNAILLFNILEHLPSHAHALAEARRLLRPGGQLLGVIPFLINVHRDPEDYVRFTDTALAALFANSGFAVKVIEPIGRGPFLAAYEQLDMFIWNPLHLVFLPVVWLLDRVAQCICPRRNLRAQFPLAYNFIVEKGV
jgi:SAM-dependent methyltransferase